MRISDWSSDVCSSDLFGVAYPADRSWRAHADRGSYCRHAGPRCLWLEGSGRGRSFRAGGYLRQRSTDRTNQTATKAQGNYPERRSEPLVKAVSAYCWNGDKRRAYAQRTRDGVGADGGHTITNKSTCKQSARR